jgi:hypothetical protein
MSDSLKFEGTVDVYGGGGLFDVGPTIGDRNITEAIEATFGAYAQPNVRVYLGIEPLATGKLYSYGGFGGTDVTPAELPEITVGDLDRLGRLHALDGRHVLLVIEPLDPVA